MDVDNQRGRDEGSVESAEIYVPALRFVPRPLARDEERRFESSPRGLPQ